jgi:hypothetical protein
LPTYDILARFFRDYERLTDDQREAFKRTRNQFVDDLKSARGFRPGLRVKRVEGTDLASSPP